VLVEKASTVVPREAVGNWLYGVARRAALLARRKIVRRRERVGEMPDCPAPEPLDDLRVALDEELSRLPDVYRTVVVLCDLEGRTRREAAIQLGCPATRCWLGRSWPAAHNFDTCSAAASPRPVP
jgi:DNA-directed RNA polymerase specialized sigma24 family protein